jgi:SprT protein
MKVLTLKTELKDRVEETVVAFICKAESKLGRTFPHIKVEFKNIGTTGGKFHYGKRNPFTNEKSGMKIVINTTLLAENVEEFMVRTIPHEVAHYIDYMLHNKSDHGYHWQAIMGGIFGCEVSRCHSYDVTNARIKTYRKFRYACECQTMDLTTVMHNKIRRGSVRSCRRCHTVVKFTGMEVK